MTSEELHARMPDEMLVAMVATSGDEEAAAELQRRGLEVPVPFDVRRAADDAEYELPPDEGEIVPVDIEVGPETPKQNLPTTVLEDLAADGDRAAAAELQYRYPGRFDEAGRRITRP